MVNRKAAASRRGSQLLLRLTSTEFDVLDAAAHLSRQTANAYAYQLLRQHIAVLETDEFVARHVENRKRYELAASGTIALADRARGAIEVTDQDEDGSPLHRSRES
jgi:hypothetical protein